MCNLPKEDHYISWAIRPTTDVSTLDSAGIIKADEDTAGHFFMSLEVRESLLHQLSGSPTLLSVFTKIMKELDSVSPPPSPPPAPSPRSARPSTSRPSPS